MNRIQLVSYDFKALFFVMVVLSMSFSVYAKDKDCWADFFEGAQYEGKHFLLQGPVQLAFLTHVNGENWESRISSIKTGPKATVTVYQNRYFQLKATGKPMTPELMRSWGLTADDIKEDSELIFNANSMVHNLSDFNFSQKIKSLRIDCVQ